MLDTAEITVVALPEATARDSPAGWVAAMALAWAAFLGLFVTSAVVAVVRWRRAGAE